MLLIAQSDFQATGNFKKDLQSKTTLESKNEIALASNYYEILIASQKLSPAQLMQIGLNYLKIEKYSEAIEVFKTIINKYYLKFPICRYYLAEAYFRKGDLSLSKSEFKTFADNYLFSSDSFKIVLNESLSRCDSMLKFARVQKPKSIQLLSSTAEMFSPSMDNKGCFYYVQSTKKWASETKNDVIEKRKIVTIHSDSSILTTYINSENTLQGDVFVSEDGNILIFSRKTNGVNSSASQVLYARKIDGIWERPVVFEYPINVEGYNSLYGSIVKINQDYYLYYSSNKPDGKGGLDIYFAELNSDFKVVKDSILPNEINSTFDEITPFYNKQNATIYFSTNNARNNFGGFDIFSYKREVNESIVNLNMPFNSGADDFFYRTVDREGFLESNRETPTSSGDHKVYKFEVEKNDMSITVSSNYKTQENYKLSVDENAVTIYYSDTSQLHSIAIEQNKKYRIKVKQDNYIDIDTSINIGNLEEGQKLMINLFMEPIINIEGKVYFVDYDSSAPKVKQCVVELIDISNNKERVIYTTTINKQNRKYSFQLPTDKQVKLKVRADDYNTYDTVFMLQSFKSPGGFINNIQLHQIQKNNILFLDSLFVLDDEIRTYNDFDETIKPIASSFNKNENIKAELTIQLITTDNAKNDFPVPSSLEDIINKYFIKDININKQIIKVKSTSRNQDWYKLYLTYK